MFTFYLLPRIHPLSRASIQGNPVNRAVLLRVMLREKKLVIPAKAGTHRRNADEYIPIAQHFSLLDRAYGSRLSPG
jgi:putative hemolysin